MENAGFVLISWVLERSRLEDMFYEIEQAGTTMILVATLVLAA